MRKMMFGFMALLMCIAMISCDNKKSQLKKAAEQANLECPFEMGAVGSVTSITYDEDNNTFIYEYDMKEDFNNVQILSDHLDLMKESMMVTISNDTEGLRKMADLIIDAEGSLKFIYHGLKTGATMNLTLNTEELKTALNLETTKLDALKMEIDMTNLQMPMQIAQGLQVTSMRIIGNDVTYICEMDPNLYNLSQLQENADNAKNGIINFLLYSGPVERIFITKIIDAGLNLAYRYCYAGDLEGESFIVTLTNDELRGFMK